jgi:imidazolonepropionase-like amidohydrolase
MRTVTLAALFAATLMGGALEAQATAYVDATIWDGTGAAPIRHAALVVEDGRVTAVGADVEPPDGAEIVSLAGKHVLPGLIDTHAHLSGRWASGEVHSDIERIRGELLLFARYGVTTVNSLGDDEAVLAARDAAQPTDARARLFAAGPVITATDPRDARRAALANADAGADWLKLRVDDNLGTTPKMPWDAVQAVVEVGGERGIRVATHVFYLGDAKRLLEMGSGLIAHSVRDTDVDEAFIDALKSSDVCYVPTLVREVSTFVYGERPGFVDDDFFTEYADSAEVARVTSEDFMEATRRSPAARGYRLALVQAMANLKALEEAEVKIAFGTDAGPPARFPGYFEHMELALMVGAGLTPAEALRSATGVAASCLGLDDVGTLTAGKWADFLVLGADPLSDVTNTQTLERVYVAGNRVR